MAGTANPDQHPGLQLKVERIVKKTGSSRPQQTANSQLAILTVDLRTDLCLLQVALQVVDLGLNLFQLGLLGSQRGVHGVQCLLQSNKAAGNEAMLSWERVHSQRVQTDTETELLE